MRTEVYNLLFENESTHWWFCGRRKIVFHFLNKYVKNLSHIRILDVGCGTGKTLESLQSLGCKKIYGIDSSIDAINYSKKRNLNVTSSTLEDLPFEDGFFDLVLALDVIEHTKDDFKALNEISRVITKNGILLTTVPAYNFLWSDHDVFNKHFRRYTKQELDRLINKNNLKIIKSSYFNTLLSPMALIRKFIKDDKNKNLMKTPMPLLNDILFKIFSSELFFIDTINMPFGVSILNIAIKKD